MRILNILAVIFLFLGCQQDEQDEDQAGLRLPEGWSAEQREESVGIELNGWLGLLGDEALVKAVDEALLANFDLRMAEVRVKEALALADLAGVEGLPQVNLEGSGQRRRGGVGENRNEFEEYSLFARLNWEIDIWGKIKDSRNRAESELKSKEFSYQAARLSLVGTVVRLWYSAVTAKLQLIVAERTEKSLKQTYEVVEGRFLRGLTGALDVRLAGVDLAKARQNLQQRKIDFDRSLRALELLLGRYPSAKLSVSETLPEVKGEINAGLPAELLNRRPDIKAALYSLSAAKFKVDEKEKELLPGIRLIANVGNSVENLEKLFDAEQILWSIGGSLTQPILDGGRIRSEIDLAKAGEDLKILEIRKLIFEACSEVENSIQGEKILVEKERQVMNLEIEAKSAFELASDSYNRGLTDVVTLLTAQRSYLSSESNMAEVKLERLLNRVNLFLALGGDFNKLSSAEEEVK